MAIDYSIFTAEPYDPCAILAVLRPVYLELMIEGAGASRIKFRDRDVEFGKRDTTYLAAWITRLESECASASGRSRPRQAITAGAFSPCRRFF